jgi:outer membrane receptor protein involved in Fe transport
VKSPISLPSFYQGIFPYSQIDGLIFYLLPLYFNMSRLLLILFIFSGPINSFSQGKLSAKIVDQVNSKPLEFASIALYNSVDSALIHGGISDEAGRFELNRIEPGEYFMITSFIGYQSQTRSISNFEKNETRDLGEIFLTPDQLNLGEVEVQAQRFTSNFQVDKQSYSAESFETAEGGTAADLMRNLPGVSINPDGNITIRGSSGFVIMVNGKAVQADPMTYLNQLPANSIENIEWITAPSAQYDAEGKAGIINITTKKGAADGLFLQINSRYGLPAVENYDNKARQKRYGGDFNLNYVNGKWDLSLGASYQRNDISGRRVGEVSTTDGDTTTYFPSDGERSIDETNYSGRFTLGFNPNPKNSFSLGFFTGVRDKLRTADILYFDNRIEVNGQRQPSFQYFNGNDQNRRGDVALASLDYAHIFENTAKLSTSILYEYSLLGGPTINRNLGFPNTEIVYQDEFNTNDNPLNGWRVNLDYAFRPLAIGQVQIGYQFRSLDHRGDFVYERKNNETGQFELVPEFSSRVKLNRKIHAAYFQLDKKLEKLSYGLGLRLETMNRDFNLQDKAGLIDTLYQYDFVRPFFSGNMVYELKEDLKLKTNFSQRIERTTTFKMNPFSEREHSETLEQGDPELLPEFINLFEVGVIKEWKSNSFYLTGYYSHISNLVNRVNTVYNDTILNRIYSNVGDASSVGFDSGLEIFPMENWKLFGGVNLYYYSIKGSFDDRPVNTASWVYSLNLNSTWTLSTSASLQFTLNYLSNRVTAQGEDSRFYTPSLSFKKSWLDDRLSLNLIWQNMDLGLLKTNEQRITTFRPNDFFTTTNYIQEVDLFILNLSYSINKLNNKSRFVKSEFGEKEF